MTRPIFEPSLQRTDARLGYTSNQLLRRPAPTTDSVIAIGYFTATAQSIGASGANINWSGPDETMAVSADYYGLNAGSDPQINLPGVYAFTFQVMELPSFTAGTTATFYMNMDVSGGTNGFWTSGTTGDDAEGIWLLQMQDALGSDIFFDGGTYLTGYATWLTGATFPVTMQWFAQFREDQVGVTRTASFRLSFLRLGDADA